MPTSPEQPHSITPNTPLGGAIYPFLEALGRAWIMYSHALNPMPTYAGGAATFGQTNPTLRWINGDKVKDVFVEGLDTAAFLQQTGLQLSMDKGGLVLSKRLSRLMRPYFIAGFFPIEQLHLQYLADLSPREQKMWDGAGLISRALLHLLVEHLPPNISPRKRKALTHLLKHSKRVEFTLLTPRGQDKGHAYVRDDLNVHLVLPMDTKSQVQLHRGSVFVGIYPVQGQDELRLDLQSLINLYPFFDVPSLLHWLTEAGAWFVESIRTAHFGEAMTHLDPYATLAEIETWPVREYLLRGGQLTWAGSMMRAVFAQYLSRLGSMTKGKIRLPVPGGRYDLMTDVVGGKNIPYGQLALDRTAHTAWVNREEWVDEIANILGGADQDDAVWVFPFTDYDNQPKILVWRSPNQVGEYTVLTPTTDTLPIFWQTVEGTRSYPQADSRLLPPRIDTQTVQYLNLVNETTAGGLGEGMLYSIENMEPARERALLNTGALGMYCNLLMISQAVYQRLPAQPPAPLEQVIDGSVKTGVNLLPVKHWCEAASAKIIQQGKPIPPLLLKRLIVHKEVGYPQIAHNHWLNDLMAGVEEQIQTLRREQNTFIQDTMPPLAVIAYVFDQPDLLKKGGQFNQRYQQTLQQAKHHHHPLNKADYHKAYAVCQTYLAQYEEVGDILLGAWVSSYLHPPFGHDRSVWQVHPERYSQGRSIAGQLMDALSDLGLLDQLDETEGFGLLQYPSASIQTTPAYLIHLKGVWFNWLNAKQVYQGKMPFEEMQAVPRSQMQAAKLQIQKLARTTFRELTLRLHQVGARWVAYTPQGNLFGYLSPASVAQLNPVPDQSIILEYSIAQDGNLIAFFQKSEPPR